MSSVPAKLIFSDWIKKFRNWRKRLSAALRKLAEGRGVPYAAVYDVPTAFKIPPDFDLSHYKGLALCHVISNRSPGSSDLIVYWRTEAHFRAKSSALAADLSLPMSSCEGFVPNIVIKKAGWSKRFSWLWKGALITTAAAVFAAVVALRGYVAQAIETPDVQVSFPDLSRLDLRPEEPFSVSVRVLNDSVYSYTSLQSVSAVAEPKGGGKSVPLTPEWPRIPRLDAGQSTEIKLSGIAPRRRSPNGPLETYDVDVIIKATTGWIHKRATAFKAVTSRQLAVWPTKIGSTCATVVRGGGRDGKPDNAAQLNVLLLPGASYPSGAVGSALITTAPDKITRIAVEKYEIAELPPSPPGALIVREVQFHVPQLEGHRAFLLLIDLEAGHSLQQSEWDELISCPNLEVSAEE